MSSGASEPRRNARLSVITNIPTPYRIHQFSVLHERMLRRGLDLQVFFLAHTHKGRLWSLDEKDWTFPGTVARGRVLYLGEGRPLYVISPSDIREAVRSNPRWLLLGAGWYQPIVALLAFAAASTTDVFFWIEDTPHEQRFGKRLEWLKRVVYRRASAFVVAGSRSEEFVRRYSDRETIHLPNFVDERLYADRVDQLRTRSGSLRSRLGIGSETILFLWPARLHQWKGILPFLHSIRNVSGDYTIAIAGEGPQAETIRRFIAQGATEKVRLLGHQSEEEMLELYSMADVLLLPSVREPFGFAAVEGLWAGLPIVISKRAGATPEVIEPCAKNGWVLDPTSPEDVVRVFRTALSAGKEKLSNMGRRSRILANARFRSTRVADSFIDALLRRFPA